MFEKILIASELNVNMKKVIEPLEGLKILGTKTCLILQCIKPQELNTDYKDMVVGWYHETLNNERLILENMGFQVDSHMGEGILKHEINEIAKNEEVSLIVVGSEATTALGEVIWGGAAHEIIHHLVKPVLQIRVDPSISLPKPIGLLDHLLFPTDFSESANLAFETLLDMATHDIRTVTLAHVSDFEEKVPLAKEILQGMKEKLVNKGVTNVRTVVGVGNPTKELLTIIKLEEISLVVMSTQGHGLIEELFLGSVSHNVARHSQASVLLIPARL
ncbi:universal stress protein [Fusibacter tunisiensis]|uniref:Nucleotide-binding universal stress UspA family protein n=1 Tax=Fusibacter tunisiensis TaxID=1008308 RepID=A0ABS2MN42_9FIRM|nr:universal stress protein [Fusibacter tunisiensis]MBM7560809.1 nucleotide-binding universal stress UspA family protein [Fusibacter tunisiensis]